MSTSSGATSDPSAIDGSGTEAATTTESPVPESCQDPHPVPASPFDCSGADGVIDTSVILEDGGDDPGLLEGVRRVEGSLRINRTSLTNLDFMGCVEEVTGDVTIYGNDALVDVNGLSSLRTIGTDFVFSSNDALVDFDGLPNVTEILGNLVIRDNGSLEVISGFHSLESLVGYAFINDEGQDDFTGGNLTIQLNPVLRSVVGLGGLRWVEGVFSVTHNPTLCISSVNCVGAGITDPAVPPESWTTSANDDGC